MVHGGMIKFESSSNERTNWGFLNRWSVKIG